MAICIGIEYEIDVDTELEISDRLEVGPAKEVGEEDDTSPELESFDRGAGDLAEIFGRFSEGHFLRRI